MISREIASLQHPIVKHLVQLRQERNYRKERQTALVTGIKLIEELAFCKTVLIQKGTPWPEGVVAEQTFIVSPAIIKKVTALENPEPIAAEVALPPPANLAGKNYLVALDGINDPGNLGTLLRTALALGWEGAFITADSVDPFNDKALRAAKGATFRLPINVGSGAELEDLIKRNRLHAYVADAAGPPVTSIILHKPLLLVLGNEAHGARAALKQVNPALSIPMSPAMESLNVASAGAILMYNMKRQVDDVR